MNGLYQVLLFLFIFGVVTQGINELGVFDYTLPTNGAQLNESAVQDIQSGTEKMDMNPFNGILIALSFMKVIGAGVLAMFCVAPLIFSLFTMAGADGTWAMIIAGLIQAPLTFITLFGLYEWWTGRSLT